MTTMLPQQSQPDLAPLDYAWLDRELDKVKTSVFLGNNAAFLGSIMSSMSFHWDERIKTACTNGIELRWNPRFFMSRSRSFNKAVLVHELWHPALMHMIRLGDRDPEIWNIAADIAINNPMVKEGYSFEDFPAWIDHKYDNWSSEQIYDDLIKQRDEILQKFQIQWLQPGEDFGGEGGMFDIELPGAGETQKGLVHTIINNVVAAQNAAIMAGCGKLPGEVEVTLKKFLAPKLPWERLLDQFFNELDNKDYSLSRPNRRYQDVYMSSLIDDNDGLDHLAYFLDVSGSVTDDMIIRFHSEFKHVKDKYRPKKMTMLQFDTIIQKEDVFEQEDPFEETHVIGRGGTCLVCVRDWIVEHKPTAAVIFTDLQVSPMEPLRPGEMIPIIWVGLNADTSHKPPHGTVIHIRE
jgi:predicted metal-dependent peptidase